MKQPRTQIRETLGAFERVSFPSLGIQNIIAKVDTGADSGALHCASIELINRESDGAKVLKFVPIGHDSRLSREPIETTSFTRARVRSSSGHQLPRYRIDTHVIIRGREYAIRIGLSDRSDMQTDVLIGRKFLRACNACRCTN